MKNNIKKNNIEKSLIKDFLVSNIFSTDFPPALWEKYAYKWRSLLENDDHIIDRANFESGWAAINPSEHQKFNGSSKTDK